MSTTSPPAQCPVDHSTLSKAAWEKISKQHAARAAAAPLPSSPSPSSASSSPAPLACDSSVFSAPPPPALSAASASAAVRTVGDLFPDATPSPTQRLPLSTAPVSSTIPRAGVDPATSAPHTTWTFPSPQRFFNAMTKKGWNPRERDMASVVSIHNTVNEETWRRVQEYERLHSAQCADIRLARFRGRPNDPSVKARLMGWAGYTAPFDRHDWVVDRCGKEVRYIIDFYAGHDESGLVPGGGKAAAIHIDARPALDSPGALYDRLKMQAKTWM